MRKSPSMLLVEARTGRDLAGLLRELYVEKRHTQQEIADALGVTHTTVGNWLEAFAITADQRAPIVLEQAVPA